MKSTFIINEEQEKEEVFITTPNRDGTIVIRDDVIDYDYKNDAIPVYRDCADGNKRIVRGPVEIIREEDGSIGSAQAIKVHTDNSDVFLKVSERGTTQQIVPSGNGYLLNSASVIDCGEVEFEGEVVKLKTENIGKTSKDLEE